MIICSELGHGATRCLRSLSSVVFVGSGGV